MPAKKTSPVVVTNTINKRTLLFASLLLLLLIAAAAPSYYFYTEYKKAQLKLQDPASATEMEITLLVKEIGSVMLLPEGEQPTLATVSDAEKLKGQEFFKHAQNGDKVLIYSQAKKAILYRPSVNKIIEVSPLQLAEKLQPTPSAGPEPTQSAPVTTTIYNGTSKSGLTTTVEKELTTKVPGVIVDAKESATKTDYKRTILINVSGKVPQNSMQQIAQAINADITNMPSTEVKPKTDLLIIVGSDRIVSPTPLATGAATPTAASQAEATPTEQAETSSE